MGFVAQFLTNTGQRSFEMVFDFMTTGQAVPAAIGAALADPRRTVCAFEGDASFMMHVQEIDTAARYGAAPLIFVINDQALGAEYHKLRAMVSTPARRSYQCPTSYGSSRHSAAEACASIGPRQFEKSCTGTTPPADLTSWTAR